MLNPFTSLWEETAWGGREEPFNIFQLPGIHVCSKLHFNVNSLCVVVGTGAGGGGMASDKTEGERQREINHSNKSIRRAFKGGTT